MKLKDYKPKYSMCEIIDYKRLRFYKMSKEQADEEFGDYDVESVKDYPDTKTTSIIISKRSISAW